MLRTILTLTGIIYVAENVLVQSIDSMLLGIFSVILLGVLIGGFIIEPKLTKWRTYEIILAVSVLVTILQIGFAWLFHLNWRFGYLTSIDTGIVNNVSLIMEHLVKRIPYYALPLLLGVGLHTLVIFCFKLKKK